MTKHARQAHKVFAARLPNVDRRLDCRYLSVPIGIQWLGQRPVNLIIFAQALTVLGFPALAAAMLFLATRRDLLGAGGAPLWLKVVAVLAVVMVTFLAIRTAARIYLGLMVN